MYRLDAVPLRGDEAFAVQYWAGSPTEVIPDLADQEPHPLGTFVSFWAWKRIAGASEFAMRYFPLLGNLLGAAAIAALAQRLFHDRRAAILAAALWAVNPHLIWHSQDVRNYALWAALSPLAMWLFVRAADRNRARDWALYVVAEFAALYMFYLEGLLLAVQASYILIFRRSWRVAASALAAWIVLGVGLVPWLAQLWYL
ncbi:MAG: glycosyltransferase family 39 protein, partial [Thermoleophilia bacterium]|nr:glycosyltransferase family 39 protein [Thermoleophilia bacterium]